MPCVHAKEKFMSSRDGLKHATVDKSAVGKLLCHWERDCLGGGLIARWSRGCLIGLRTPHGGADSRQAGSADGKPANASEPHAGDVEAVSVQPPVPARRARHLVAAAVIAALCLFARLALVLTFRGPESL
jgi:hypothetical protein